MNDDGKIDSNIGTCDNTMSEKIRSIHSINTENPTQTRKYNIVPTFISVDVLCHGILPFVPLCDLISNFLPVNSFFRSVVWKTLNNCKRYREDVIISRKDFKFFEGKFGIMYVEMKEEDYELGENVITNFKLLMKLIKIGCFEFRKIAWKVFLFLNRVRRLHKSCRNRNWFKNRYNFLELADFIHELVNLNEFEKEEDPKNFEESFLSFEFCNSILEDDYSKERRLKNLDTDNNHIRELAKSRKFRLPTREEVMWLQPQMFHSIVLSCTIPDFHLTQGDLIRFLMSGQRGLPCPCCPGFHFASPFRAAVDWCMNNKKIVEENGIHLTQKDVDDLFGMNPKYGLAFASKIEEIGRFISEFGFFDEFGKYYPKENLEEYVRDLMWESNEAKIIKNHKEFRNAQRNDEYEIWEDEYFEGRGRNLRGGKNSRKLTKDVYLSEHSRGCWNKDKYVKRKKNKKKNVRKRGKKLF